MIYEPFHKPTLIKAALPGDKMSLMLLGLDYELFFGQRTGSVEHCMLHPTEALVAALEAANTRHSPKITLFVDACYLLRLKQLERLHPELQLRRSAIQRQLNRLSLKGHSIQLHIHPHWLDSDYQDGSWITDTSRYRLHDLDAREKASLIIESKQLLEECSEANVFAYRAGGWCLQPFDQIADALSDAGIWMDSTVYSGGLCEDPLRWFDFRGAPDKSHWTFDTDPLKEDEQGRFVELPISQQQVSPLFFWRMAWLKKFGNADDIKPFGDGASMVAHSAYYLERLTRHSAGPASIDGIKGDLLEDAWQQHCSDNPAGYFNVMGHPKALTQRSITRLVEFLERHQDVELVGFEELEHLKPAQLNTPEMPQLVLNQLEEQPKVHQPLKRAFG